MRRRAKRVERLRRALDALSVEYRQVLLWASVEGLAVEEIATRIGQSRDEASVVLLRATRALRRAFTQTNSVGVVARRLEIDMSPAESA